MDDFLRFFDKVRARVPMHIDISYGSVTDWMIVIYRGRSHLKSQEEIVNVQSCDMELCFAMAQVELKEWLMKECGGVLSNGKSEAGIYAEAYEDAARLMHLLPTVEMEEPEREKG